MIVLGRMHDGVSLVLVLVLYRLPITNEIKRIQPVQIG